MSFAALVAAACVALAMSSHEGAEVSVFPVMIAIGITPFAWAAMVLGAYRVTRFLVALIEENRDLAAQLRQAHRNGAQ